jgi:hypothetical protein
MVSRSKRKIWLGTVALFLCVATAASLMTNATDEVEDPRYPESPENKKLLKKFEK